MVVGVRLHPAETWELVVVQDELDGLMDVQLTKKSVIVVEAVQLWLELDAEDVVCDLDAVVSCVLSDGCCADVGSGSGLLACGLSGGALLLGGGPESGGHSPAMRTPKTLMHGREKVGS